MALDIATVRDATPGCENVLHFNNAGASLTTQLVLDAVISHLQLEANIGGYEAAARALPALENTYDALARMLGCSRDEIAVVENATRAWDMAFYSIPFKPGDKILTSPAEYASNYIALLQVAKRTGAEIQVIPNDEYGQISLEQLKNALDERVKLIALTHIPTNGGLVNPAAAVGKLAKAAGVLYLLDACQSAGQMPLNVDELGCDFLSATGRKFLRAPRGTGFLYVRKDLITQLEPPFLDLHAASWTARNEYTIRSDARRFENWETNTAAKIGLGVAVDYALQLGLENIWERLQSLSTLLRQQLAALPGVTVQDLGAVKSAIVTFSAADKEADFIKAELAKRKMNVSVTGLPFARLDMEERGLTNLVRASVHYYNTEEEVGRFCHAVGKISQ